MFRLHLIHFQGAKRKINAQMVKMLEFLALQRSINIEIHNIPRGSRRKMLAEFEKILGMIGGLCDIICIGTDTGAPMMFKILERRDVLIKKILSINPRSFLKLLIHLPIKPRAGVSSRTINFHVKSGTNRGLPVKGAENHIINYVFPMIFTKDVIYETLSEMILGAE